MVNYKKWISILGIVLMVFISACGQSSGEESENTFEEGTVIEESMDDEGVNSEEEEVQIHAEGSLVISGSNQLSPLTQVIADKFGETYSSIDISISNSADDSFGPFCSADSSFHQATRTINEEEKQSCEENMIEYKEFQMAGSKDSQPLYFYVSLDILSGMEGYEFVSLYLQEAPKLAEQLGYTPLSQAVYDEGLVKLDE